MIDLDFSLVIVAVVAGLIALSAVAGCLFATVFHAREDAGSEPAAGGEPATASSAEVEAAGERYGRAVEHFSQALKAFEVAPELVIITAAGDEVLGFAVEAAATGARALLVLPAGPEDSETARAREERLLEIVRAGG